MLRTWYRHLAHRQSQASLCRRHTAARGKPSYRPRLEGLELRLSPATHTWTGAVNNLWSVPGNWTGGTPAGDANADLVFPAASRKDSLDDFAGPLSVHSILLDAGQFP